MIPMASLIGGGDIAASADDIINDSERSLVLASGDLALPESLKRRIRRGGEVPDIRLWYRDRFIVRNSSDIKLLQDSRNIRVFVCDRLHVSIFMNESAGIVTSFNLFSEPGRPLIDLGVFFTEGSDGELFCRVRDAMETIEAESRLQTDFSGSSPQRPAMKNQGRGRAGTGPEGRGLFSKFFHEALGGGGYCIVCGAPMSYQKENPRCMHCLSKKAGGTDADGNGFYCHNCGAAARVTPAVPFCKRCLSDTLPR
jgi:hypothetical protein